MVSHARYPGLDTLRAIEARVQAFDSGVAPADLPRVMDELHAAASRGLPLSGWLDATRVFFMAIQDALDRTDDLLDLSDALVTRILDAAHRDWLPQLPLLPSDAQTNAWHLLDLLYANRVRSHHVDVFVREAEAFMVGSPVPAVQTALQLVLRLGSLDPRDSRIPWMIDFLQRNAGDESALVAIAALQQRLDIAYQQALVRVGRNATDGLQALWTLNEAISETFGGDIVVTTPDAVDSRTRQQMSEAAQVLESRALDVSAGIDMRDPFAEGLLEYLMARIAAAGGTLSEAIRVFERLISKEFCLVDSAAYLARIWLERGYPEDARAVLERAAPRIPLVRDGQVPFPNLAELYLEAGGDPAHLALAEAPQRFVERAEANRASRQDHFRAALDEARDRALSEFWDRRERTLLAHLGRQVQAADFDATLDGAGNGRLLRLGPEVAATTCLDEMPGIPQAVRDILLAATVAPIASRDVVPHVLTLLRDLEDRGHSFEELARDFPGYGRSRAVAQERLSGVLAKGRPGDALALLEAYASIAEVPDDVLATLCDKALPALAEAGQRIAAVKAGSRLWRRMRGEPGRRTGILCREVAFAGLDDPAIRPEWPLLVEVILDLMPDHDAQAVLWEWFREHFAHTPPDEVKIGLAARLARRLSAPFQEWARTLAREAIAAHLDGLVALDGPGARRTVLQSLLDLGEGDPVVVEPILTWLTGTNPLDCEELADLGEWLVPRLSDSQALPVRRFTRERLLEQLNRQKSPDVQNRLIERMFAMTPDDPALGAMLDEIRRARARFRWVVGGIALAAVGAIVALFVFLT